MSVFAIRELCYRLRNDAAFEERFLAEPEGGAEQLELTAEERRALLAGDVYTLHHEMGAHAYLLHVLPAKGVFGLNRDNYLPRIRGEEPVATT